MKCPKCGYLGFETGDRCRNCGYDFSLTPVASGGVDLTLDADVEGVRQPLDLDRMFGDTTDVAGDLPLFGSDDAPLVSVPARPRAPLGVRRATPEVPRARPHVDRRQTPTDSLFEASPRAPAITRPAERVAVSVPRETAAAPARRILAGVIDISLLSALDAGIVYFTLRVLGLSSADVLDLPLVPLVAFFFLLNGGYFIAFTAVGGQSVGKMALGIRVIGQEDESVPIGRATLRTLAYLVSALPFGAGFLPGVIGGDGLALHDRLAHTRVIRPSST